MNNTQLYLSIGVPTLTVILAWLSNRSDINRLNDKVDKLNDKGDRLNDSLRSDIKQSADALRSEMITFRREVHGDLIMLHERVVKVETRQGI
jgi:hypothetical protein